MPQIDLCFLPPTHLNPPVSTTTSLRSHAAPLLSPPLVLMHRSTYLPSLGPETFQIRQLFILSLNLSPMCKSAIFIQFFPKIYPALCSKIKILLVFGNHHL